jgi:hypothetical protein
MHRNRRNLDSFQNYQFDRKTVAADGTNRVVLVPAPPFGVSYRIFFLNGLNNSGGARALIGEVHDSTNAKFYRAFQTIAIDGLPWLTGVPAFDIAEFPTIAVLDNSDETFEISLTDTGTMTVSACYEILDQEGGRTFRNSFATTNGTSEVELAPAPSLGQVHRFLSVNGLNDSGGPRNFFFWAGTGSTDGLFALTAVDGVPFRQIVTTFQSPFPPFVLADTGDSLVGTLNDTGALDIITNYEILSRRIV